MELRHLRYFLAVAEAGHFGRAALSLHVTQPALSQQIKQLEEELGAPLLERGRRGARLTPEGEAFRAYASRAIEDVSAGKRAVGELRGLSSGALRVGYPPSLRAVVVPAIAAVLRRHPGVRVAADEAVIERVERRLGEGKLDVGVGFSPSSLPGLDAEALFDSRLALVVSPRHPLASAESAAARHLGAEPFALLARGLRARSRADAYFASIRLSPRVVLESNAVATLLAVVRAGLAVSVLPEPRLGDAERVAVVRLTPSPPSELAALLWRSGAPRHPAALAFAEELRAKAEAV